MGSEAGIMETHRISALLAVHIGYYVLSLTSALTCVVGSAHHLRSRWSPPASSVCRLLLLLMCTRPPTLGPGWQLSGLFSTAPRPNGRGRSRLDPAWALTSGRTPDVRVRSGGIRVRIAVVTWLRRKKKA